MSCCTLFYTSVGPWYVVAVEGAVVYVLLQKWASINREGRADSAVLAHFRSWPSMRADSKPYYEYHVSHQYQRSGPCAASR